MVFGHCHRRVHLSLEISEHLHLHIVLLEVSSGNVHLYVVEGHSVVEYVHDAVVFEEYLLFDLELDSQERRCIRGYVTEVDQVTFVLDKAELFFLFQPLVVEFLPFQ